MNIMSCVTSYILIANISFIREVEWFKELFDVIPNTAIINSCFAVLLGTVLALVIACIFSAKWFSKISIKIFHKTLNDDIWMDVLDFKEGSNLKVYLKDKDYYVIGHHKNHEEKGNDSWLALSAFGKYSKETNKACDGENLYHDKENVIYTVRFSDIEHIEIF